MIRFLKISTLFLAVVLLAGCKAPDDFEGIAGPMVRSLAPNITVEKWEYLSPEELSQSDISPDFPDDDEIVFGDDPHRALIIWTEQGFDLYWGEFPCATKPVVLIKETAVIELFGGKQPPPPLECVAMEVIHGFTVTLSSATPLPPASEWTYSFRPSEK